ncbi:MAG: 2-oxoacid:acceptor oxidoreductase family protein [Desulfobacterales bacterium]|nr:MAG: 2-oxoacid:acceptor oxidoreductase family protein [Desulfobacterales bacterium]
MYEIRFHGRGGQGTVVASVLLAKAFFKDGYHVQTFPVFGLERRGAPVEAYLRLDEKKILIRSNVYAPDHVIVQDIKLLGNVDVSQGLKPGGSILFNAKDIFDDLEPFTGFRLAFVDATQIAVNNQLGNRTNPIVNTAMLGAFARVIKMPSMTAIAEAVSDEIQIKTNQNVQAAKEAYENVKIYGVAP